MNRKEKQKEKEKSIFREFVEVCSLEINEESIKSGDESKNEPDILCQLKDGSSLAFELTEAVDNKIPQKDHIIEKAGKFWEDYKNNTLPKDKKERFERVFSGCSLSLTITDDATQNHIKKAIPKIFERYQNSCRDQLGLIHHEQDNLPKGCEIIRIEPRDAAPIFICSSGSFISSACIEALRKKFGKTYKNNHSIHLLVYNDHHPFFFVQSDIKTYIEENIDSSPFERIWFFDRCSGKMKEIVYVFP
jgi:hypothetical protein